MAIDALSWAVHLPDSAASPQALRTLAVMADAASSQGFLVWMSGARLEQLRDISAATRNRHISELHQAGLIVPGDPSVVGHLPANRRPKVWAINAPARGLRGETPDPARGLSFDIPGVSPGDSTVIGRSVIDPSKLPTPRQSRARASAPTSLYVWSAHPGQDCAHGAEMLIYTDSRTGITAAKCAMCRRAGKWVTTTPAKENRDASAA